MKKMTPRQCADKWGITEREVMKKVYNTLMNKAHVRHNSDNALPEEITVRRMNPDNYIIRVPDGFKFQRLA